MSTEDAINPETQAVDPRRSLVQTFPDFVIKPSRFSQLEITAGASSLDESMSPDNAISSGRVLIMNTISHRELEPFLLSLQLQYPGEESYYLMTTRRDEIKWMFRLISSRLSPEGFVPGRWRGCTGKRPDQPFTVGLSSARVLGLGPTAGGSPDRASMSLEDAINPGTETADKPDVP